MQETIKIQSIYGQLIRCNHNGKASCFFLPVGKTEEAEILPDDLTIIPPTNGKQSQKPREAQQRVKSSFKPVRQAKYIRMTGQSRYELRMRLNNRQQYIGTYETLERAIAIRDELIARVITKQRNAGKWRQLPITFN
jgi:hypothetical protein